MKKSISLIVIIACIMSFSFIPAEAAAKYNGNGIRNNGVYEGITIDIYSTPYTSIAGNALAAYQDAGCTWFVSGRVKELTGKSCAINGPNYWYTTQGPENGFISTQTLPNHKAVICTEGSAVHVSILEHVYSDGSIIVSDGGCHLAPNNDYCNIGKYSSISNYMSTMGLTKLIGYVDLGVGFNGGSSNPDVDPVNPSNPTDPTDPTDPSNPTDPSDQYLHPYIIDRPDEVSSAFKMGRGLVHTGVSFIANEQSQVSDYRLLEIPEDGYLFYEAIKQGATDPVGITLYYNTNRILEACVFSDDDRYNESKIEKGTYYADLNWRNEGIEGRNQYFYLFYLPYSKGLQVAQKLSSDKTYVTLSLNSPDQMWASYQYVKGDNKKFYSGNSISGNELKITENGTYTIMAEWTRDTLWGWYPVYQTIEVTGIQKDSSGGNENPNSGSQSNQNSNSNQTNQPAKTDTTKPQTVVQKANTLKVTAKKPAALKAKTLKKKNLTIKKAKAFSIKGAQGTVTFKKVSGNKKITINKKTGVITVKKGLKKGTYPLKVKVTAAGNAGYKTGSKTVIVKIRVK